MTGMETSQVAKISVDFRIQNDAGRGGIMLDDNFSIIGNTDEVQPPSDNCWATYENGNLHIPGIKGPFGDDLHFETDMQYEPLSDPMTFQVTGAKPK